MALTEGADVFGPCHQAVEVQHGVSLRKSGYNLARMTFEIILAPSAAEELRSLPGDVRSGVRHAIELHLRHEPTKVSRSRIKRLRGLERPQYRLRVGEVRVFYDVTETAVEVLAIVTKAEAQAWLDEEGIPSAPGGPGEGQG
jgi:mRNA interferase RelE/StbE